MTSRRALTLLLPALTACAGGETLTVDGVERSFIVHLPAGYDPEVAHPLVYVLHGGGPGNRGKARRMARYTGLDALADQHGFIAVYPQGALGDWSDGRGATRADEAGIDDLAFFDALHDHLTDTLAVDPTRVYATGISNGAFMSNRLACERSERFAAIASVAGQLAAALQCAPSRPVSVLLVCGTEDPLVPYAGGAVASDRGEALSVDGSAAHWIAVDQCTGPVEEDDLPDVADDGTTIHRSRYLGCAEGAEVQVLRVEGGGHTWPGTKPYAAERWIGRTSQDLDASAAIWDFFEAHPR